VQYIRKRGALVAIATSLALGLSACGGDDSGTDPEASGEGGGGNSDAIITVNGTEPQNKLLPANTNETGGGRIMDVLYEGLVRYDENGDPVNAVAESIETEDSQTFTITLKEGQTFSDGSPVTANSFVDAWNFGANIRNAQLNSYFFEPIAGYEEVHPSPAPGAAEDAPPPAPTAEEMSGLKVVDDQTFTVELSQPQSDFPIRLGYTAFMPLPEAAFEDPDAFGEKPIGNGPYMMEGTWEHDVQIKTVKNPEYSGEEEPQNGGVDFKFYQDPAAAYQDLLADNIDVLDLLPDSAFATYEDDLGERAINQPAGIFQSFSFPLYDEKFSGPNANKVRQAISMAINREQITETIFNGTRTPAKDFSSPVVQGYSEDICGEFCEYKPDEAKALLEEAGGLPGNAMTIGYNADGGHQGWVDAVCNDIKNNLAISCEGKAFPDFKSLRDPVTKKAMDNPFRTGWQMDYPALSNFLGPIYATGAGSNDSMYENPEFDELLAKGDSAASPEEGIEFYQQAEELLVRDMPAVPLWYSNANGGYANTVENVKFDVFSVPIYTQITKQ
jgi:oligopeptide transport system substrate-binding protein